MALRIRKLAAPIVATLVLCLGFILPSWPQAAYAGDGTCGEAGAAASITWYFAEGYTGPGFQEWLTLFNPQESQVKLDLHLLYNGGSSRTLPTELPARSRATFDINALAGADAEVSLYLESQQPVVAERPMYFTYRGAWKGCTVTSGTTTLSETWYFAEGCTRGGFEEWLLLANPADAPVSVMVRFVLEDGTMVPVPVDLPPRSRRTVFVNEAVGGERDVSARVEAGAPICAERVMYFDYYGMWPGGHASSGLGQPRRTYLFAEGCTGPGFQEWLTLYAPRESGGEDGTEVILGCLFPGEEERSFQLHLDPDTRHTLYINDMVGAGKDISLQLYADEPFLAERPMYFNYLGVCRGGHVSKGVEAPGTHWYLAEGTTYYGFHTYLCLMNPAEEAASVDIGFFFAGDGSETPRRYTLPPRSRLTLRVGAPVGYFGDVAFEIDASLPIAVERPLYFPGSSFEVANAMDTIRGLSVGIGPRVEGTQGELAAARYLAEALASYGYQPRIQEVPLPNGAVTRNVIATRGPVLAIQPGYEKYLVVGGHYDTKMNTGSPGANDNASGAAVVLELARCFAEEPLGGYYVEFVFFGGEERLVENSELHHFGSRYYVANLAQDMKSRMSGAIVVDMVGVGSRLYARTMGIGPMGLCNDLMAYARGTGVYLPYMVSGSYSDHEPFENAGIPAVWLEYKDDPWYHTPGDSYDKINPAFIDNTGRLLEGFIRSS